MFKERVKCRFRHTHLKKLQAQARNFGGLSQAACPAASKQFRRSTQGGSWPGTFASG